MNIILSFAASLMLALPVLAAEIVPFDAVQWTPLNAARGDSSPQAGTLWGDRNAEVPTGFLVKFKDGFSSPPHIHNVTYRGMVISGQIHNDDPAATPIWMPAGAFWTQPAGESHITAAKGEMNMAYIEIDSGPYLVKPAKEAFDNGERPVNVDPSNIVWLSAADTKWVAHQDIEMAFLWGSLKDNHLSGTLLKLPAATNASIAASGDMLRAMVIQGNVKYAGKTLAAGSYFSVSGKAQLQATDDSLIYVRSNDAYEVLEHAE